MLKVILVLLLIAVCCIGQRRWAGSYSRIHPPEDTVTWGDGNYRKQNTETSTESSIRYRGKWPADNLKGQEGRPVVASAPHIPPIRRGEYDSRIDERPRTSIGQTEKFDTDGRRPSLPEDVYHKEEIDRPVVINEKENFPMDKGKGEGSRTNRDNPGTVDTRQLPGSNTRNTENSPGEFPRDRNHKRIPSVSTEAYDNRRRDGKGYDEVPVLQRPKGDRTQFPTQEYDRPRVEPKTGTQDDMVKIHVIRDSRNGHDQSSRADGRSGYDGIIGKPKYEIPKVGQSHDTRETARNNKGSMEKTLEDLPHGRTEGYDGRKDDVGYKGYEEIPIPATPRPQLTAREYVRPRDQIGYVGEGDRRRYKQNSGDESGDRTVLDSKQNQDERYRPAQSKGDAGYDTDRQREERLAAREYDKRREEELKQREYERRLEEEMRKKSEEKGNIGVKGTGYGSEDEEVVRKTNHDRRLITASGNENDRREDQRIKGTINRREENVKGIEPNRRQEDHSSREYIGRGIENTRREESKGRGSRVRHNESPKGNDETFRTTYDLNQDDEYRTMKGDDNIRRPDREIAQDSRKQSKAQHSQRREGGRVDRHEYSVNRKGEVYTRELDYNPIPPVSRDYEDKIRRTTSIPLDNDDLRPVETTDKRYQTRQDYDGQRKEGRTRNREINQHNTSLSERRDTDNNQRTIYHRNPGESIGFTSTVTPSYADVNDRYARRTSTRREESIEGFPIEGRNLNNGRTDDFVNPAYDDRPVDQGREISRYPSIVNSRNNARQPTKASNSWKPSTSSLGISGYHPNVSYDTIVFLDDESDDEGDVWNLSDRKANEPRQVPKDQEDYRKEYRTSIRENQGRATYRRRNEANITLIGDVVEPKRRNRRASEQYRAQETRISSDLSQMDESDYIHPDVEILPGYGITRQSGQRNYNDDVMDDEVELFSDKEIKVDSRDYKANGGIAALGSRPNSNRNSAEGRTHSELQAKLAGKNETQFNVFNEKDATPDEVVRHSHIDTEGTENSTSAYRTKVEQSDRIYNKPVRFNY